MALEDFHYAYASFGDSRGKSATVSIRVTAADANAYFGAVTQTLKDATDVGQMLLSIEELSAGNLLGKGIRLWTEDDAANYPSGDAGIYHFDKVTVHYAAGFDSYTLTIPCRDETGYTVAADGITIVDGLADDWEDFYTRFNGLVLGKNGSQGTVTKGRISS